MHQAVLFVLTHRRVVAAVLVGLAVWAALTALTRDPDTRTVTVVARDLPGGTTLRSGDLRTADLPRDVVPAGTVGAGAAVGRILSGGVRSGEVVTDRRAVDPRDLGDGLVLAAVEVPASAGEVLRTGDAVDVLAVGDDGTADVVAENTAVVTIRTDPERETTVLGVGADRRTATELARVSVTSRLTAIVRPRQPS